jgi:hypothetical protein
MITIVRQTDSARGCSDCAGEQGPSFLDWIIRAGERRRSRIHDYDGRRVPLRNTADVPVVLWQAIRRRVSGRRPDLPWIPYPVIRRLKTIVQPTWRVIETGSGYSTVWLARRVRSVRSTESDWGWYQRIQEALGRPSNVDYRYVDMSQKPHEYWTISAEDERSFDLAIVDGLYRDECIQSALRAVRAGGYIYLDNIDTAGQTAFSVLQRTIVRRGGTVEILTGFPPSQPSVTTGALAHLPERFDEADPGE